MKYRIVQSRLTKKFKIQEKSWFTFFIWGEVLFVWPPKKRVFTTKKEAQEIIDQWKKEDSDKWEVVKLN